MNICSVIKIRNPAIIFDMSFSSFPYVHLYPPLYSYQQVPSVLFTKYFSNLPTFHFHCHCLGKSPHGGCWDAQPTTPYKISPDAQLPAAIRDCHH